MKSSAGANRCGRRCCDRKKVFAMTETSSSPFSVANLFAERDARRRQEQEAAEQLARRKDEERSQFKQRLETFQLTDEILQATQQRIRRAFESGETELMFASFPSDFCSDGGRAIINAGAPPIVELTDEEKEKLKDADPEWLHTLPRGARPVYEHWKKMMKPAGFGLTVQILNFPDGKPGDVGMFFTWPKSSHEA
jgi:hypothetical protein